MAHGLTASIVDVVDLSAAQIALWKEIVSDDPLYLSPFFQPAFAQAVDFNESAVEVRKFDNSG